MAAALTSVVTLGVLICSFLPFWWYSTSVDRLPLPVSAITGFAKHSAAITLPVDAVNHQQQLDSYLQALNAKAQQTKDNALLQLQPNSDTAELYWSSNVTSTMSVHNLMPLPRLQLPPCAHYYLRLTTNATTVDLTAQDRHRARVNAMLSSFPLSLHAIATYNNSVNQECVVDVADSTSSTSAILAVLAAAVLPAASNDVAADLLPWVLASTHSATQQSTQLLQALLHEIDAVPNLEINRRLQQQVRYKWYLEHTRL